MALTWQQRLDAATSEADVVTVAKEFVAQLRGDVLDRLPPELRPAEFKDSGEVAAYAFAVVLHRLKGDGTDIAEQMQAIVTFFMGAATRLTQIMTAQRGSSGKA